VNFDETPGVSNNPTTSSWVMTNLIDYQWNDGILKYSQCSYIFSTRNWTLEKRDLSDAYDKFANGLQSIYHPWDNFEKLAIGDHFICVENVSMTVLDHFKYISYKPHFYLLLTHQFIS
jgi:hypothetical protein